MIVTNSEGNTFEVRILRNGDKYGRANCLTWGEEKYSTGGDGVEFYDTHNSEDASLWQMVSRYYIDTLLNDYSTRAPIPENEGLDLHGGVPKWSIDGNTMAKVRQYLRTSTVGSEV